MEEKKPYHHGNLRAALIETAFDIARNRGPEAVKLREVARRSGVSATAVYRHFADQKALVQATTIYMSQKLAKRMQAELEACRLSGDSKRDSLARLHAICYGYVMFAIEESELFRTMWSRNVRHASILEIHDDEPYLILSKEVDELDANDTSRATSVKIATWAAAHGLAMLVLDGPIRDLPEDDRSQLIHEAISVVTNGVPAFLAKK